MSNKVIISLAANINHLRNLSRARNLLSGFLHDVYYTKECWTKSFNSSNNHYYLNQLALAQYDGEASRLISQLKCVETQLGRSLEMKSQGIVPIDLDLMLFNHDKLHLNDWERPYIIDLFKEICNIENTFAL